MYHHLCSVVFDVDTAGHALRVKLILKLALERGRGLQNRADLGHHYHHCYHHCYCVPGCEHNNVSRLHMHKVKTQKCSFSSENQQTWHLKGNQPPPFPKTRNLRLKSRYAWVQAPDSENGRHTSSV